MPSCWAVVVTGVPLGVQGMDGLVGRDPRGMPLLVLHLPPLVLDVRALAPPPIHRGDGPGAGRQGEGLRGAGCYRLERSLLVVQESFDCLT
jgi:hypothetical protein